MIIVQAAGGLGNQMQQYALYRKFVSLGIDARLDVSWFTEAGRQDGVYARRELELELFRAINYKICTEQEKQALAGKGSLLGWVKAKLLPGSRKVFHESGMYHPEIFDFREKYLCGYFACEKYYVDILPDLRKEFTFPRSDNPENRKMAQRIEQTEAVSIHIRRGDYLDAENAAMFGGICTENYYEGAIEEIKGRYPQAHFYIFSDDIPYVKERYQGKAYTVVDINRGRSSFYDIWLMSLCRHNICANSTFSFWGARLNNHQEKVMIRPSVHKNTQKFDPVLMHELWEGWTLLDPQGRVV
ncbi:MAG: alpha-1,2-fucosyltransferase [Lachnospiraceae bacterium]|nr:alpha-1,2-fucosyltransferase [Lachnospiraceae bacterium]